MNKLPNFVIQHHLNRRNKLIEFPGLGISGFIPANVSLNSMDEILDKLQGYEIHYNRIKELFNIEKQYRRYENSCV